MPPQGMGMPPGMPPPPWMQQQQRPPPSMPPPPGQPVILRYLLYCMSLGPISYDDRTYISTQTKSF